MIYLPTSFGHWTQNLVIFASTAKCWSKLSVFFKYAEIFHNFGLLHRLMMLNLDRIFFALIKFNHHASMTNHCVCTDNILCYVQGMFIKWLLCHIWYIGLSEWIWPGSKHPQVSRLDLFHFSERIKEMQMQKFMRNDSYFKMDDCKDDAKC